MPETETRPKRRTRARHYVGIMRGGKREVITAIDTPTERTHGGCYHAVIGPFQTRGGALFMAEHGADNPHCRCVADAERLARLAASGRLSCQERPFLSTRAV